MSLLLSWSAVSSKSVKNSIVNLSPSNWTILYKWTKKYFLHLLFHGLDDLVALKSLMQMNAEEVDNNDVCVDAGWWQGWPSEDRRLICVTIRSVGWGQAEDYTHQQSHSCPAYHTVTSGHTFTTWLTIIFCMQQVLIIKKTYDFCIWILIHYFLLTFLIKNQANGFIPYILSEKYVVCPVVKARVKVRSLVSAVWPRVTSAFLVSA